MSTALSQIIRMPAPSDVLATEFGRDLYAARQDPSDPESCFHFLYAHHQERWRDVMANMDGALHEAGQLYIAAEMERA